MRAARGRIVILTKYVILSASEGPRKMLQQIRDSSSLYSSE